MIIRHDSRKICYRSPFGAVETGGEVTLSIDVIGAEVREAVLQLRRDEDAGYRSVHMTELSHDQNPDGQGPEPRGRSQELSSADTGEHARGAACGETRRFIASIKAPEESCLIWYRFRVIVEDGNSVRSVYYCNNAEGLGGEGQMIETSGELVPYQITVYKYSKTPDWYKNGIVYQIFPDRFARDDGWRERCEKANRAVNERRIDMQRTIEDDWYRPAYYVRDSAKKVVKWPMYGGSLRGILEKLDYLKSLGVSVIYLNPIFEASTNHRYDTGNYMKIDPALGTEQDFTDLAEEAERRGIKLMLDGVFSHTGADSIYFDRFGNYPREDSAAGAWQHEDSPYRSWYKFDPAEKWGYKSWWGVEDLPEVIEEDPSYQEYILGNEGVVPHWLRLGASGWRLDVADELPDSFIQGVRRAVKGTDPDALLIGEVWEDASNKISYGERRGYFSGDELDGTMNYPLRTILLDYINYTISAGQAGARLMSLAENYPRENFYGALNLIGSHDRERIITMMAADQDRRAAVSKVKLLSILEYALPGVPCIYYGDEAGLTGGADPENRSGFPWGREDRELQFHYRMLGVIYNEHPVLKDGDLIMLSGSKGMPDDVLAFMRLYQNNKKDERILVLINRSYGRTETDLSEVSGLMGTQCGYAIDLLTSEELKLGKTVMEALSAKIILILDEPPEQEDLGRDSGVICHLGSLGERPLGKKARDFVDYIKEAGFGIWQVLPVNPPGLGGSPYDSVSAFAGDPGLIDLSEVPDDSGYARFCDENAWWLHGYTAYKVIKERLGGKALPDWPDEYRYMDPEEAFRDAGRDEPELVSRIMHEQYWFAAEWSGLKSYANSRGVRMMGDIPMYMSSDSADVWADMSRGAGRLSTDGDSLAGHDGTGSGAGTCGHGQAGRIFRMDEHGRLAVHAGVPPDYFSRDGQDWGNPLYDWDELKKTGYDWWLKRIRQCAARFDILRIDHFRALSEYYAIPEGRKPAEGVWQQGPGADLIRSIKSMLVEEGLGMKLLAEDLGSLDAGVYDLLKLSGLPGMDIWQFSSYEMMAQPEEVARRRAFYSGTHDNSTLAGFTAAHAEEIIGRKVGDQAASGDEASPNEEAIGDGSMPGHGPQQLNEEDREAVESAALEMIRKIYESPAALAVIQLQDVFLLGDEARMNVPGVAEGNWKWRIPGDSIKASFADADKRASWLRELTEKTGRA